MRKHEWAAISYKLRHATTSVQKRSIIDSYPELKGRSIQKVQAMIRVYEDIILGNKESNDKRRTFASQIYRRKS